MSGNRFGTLFQYQTWGESHGPAIGVVVDGVPPRIPLSEDDIQVFLDKRKPGQSKFTTQRNEEDKVKILSGVFEGQTTGTPISLMIENTDQKSKDYGDIKDKFRPGHADFTYDAKYGIRDYRGGGRSSARETASRVAAGAIARKILMEQLGTDIFIKAAVVQMGNRHVNRDKWNWQDVDSNPFFVPDASVVPDWEEYLNGLRKDGSSIGAVVECVASGFPAGLGAPVYDKLDADLAKAMMSINAVKGFEIGDGFKTVEYGGQQNADAIRIGEEGKPVFQSNHAGGILGGISTGQDIVVRVAFKPTSSILTSVPTIDKFGNETDIITKGRHDPCVGLRGTSVVEAMMACVLCDHWLRHKAQCL
ncbi:MAG: chorismate synthase [Alphaproteobacteria bacterium RIFCSPHIGHO2_02_FULL_46_13]|nr:MAG: chorismate synthase [Alphaproteobacteria bacterium RIFCSPHIGHO2_02_FULL_46_13]